MENKLNDQVFLNLKIKKKFFKIKFAIGRIFEPLPTYFYGLVSIYNDHHITFVDFFNFF